MATLTADQTTDMLGDLAAGAIGDVFDQNELQRLYDRAGGSYELAVYYGWRQIYAESTKWVDYQVAQTKVSRSQAAAGIKDMLELWQSEARVADNQLVSAGMRPVPTNWKNIPADEYFGRRRGVYVNGRWVVR
jgi:hypothetical protein